MHTGFRHIQRENIRNCSQCSRRPAEIFEVTGKYCLGVANNNSHTNTS